MMRVTKAGTAAILIVVSAFAFANAECEKSARTRDDSLACSKADTDRMLSDSEKLYSNVRIISSGSKRIALDKNHQLWVEKIKSDCSVIGFAFNEWKNDYTPDTDFQIAACRKKIAAQELDFYKALICPEDMEMSAAPKCAAIQKVLGTSQ